MILCEIVARVKYFVHWTPSPLGTMSLGYWTF